MIKFERIGPKDSGGPWICDWCGSYHKTAYEFSSGEHSLILGRLCVWKFLKHVYNFLGKKPNGTDRL